MARVPEVVIGEPVIVNPVGTVCETDVTDPLPVPAQTPDEVRKHPEVREIPFANVEVAVDEALSPPLRIVIPET